MTIRWLNRSLSFPRPDEADAEGVVAVGGDCSVESLLLAYRSGIFPWPMTRDLPLFWFSPDPRYVIELPHAHVPRSLRKQIRRGVFEVRVDTDFAGVIRGCSATPRPGQRGTWITPALREGFSRLHELGYAHSVEAWRDGALVGGLYGLSLGGAFFGESMFAVEPDASKVAFTTLLGNLTQWGFDFVDCQTRTDHLERFNAVPWPRARFLAALDASLAKPTRVGRWTFDLDPVAALDAISG